MEPIMKQLGAVEEAVRNLVHSAARMEDRALEERREIYERIDSIRHDIAELATGLKVHEERLVAMEPVVRAIDAKEKRAEGAKHLGRLVWTTIISLITVAVSVGSQVIQYLHSKH